jgi:hypothetical protein
MEWKIHPDGCWLAFGKTGQRYEVGEASGHDYALNICGQVRILCASTAHAKEFAEEWDQTKSVDKVGEE